MNEGEGYKEEENYELQKKNTRVETESSELQCEWVMRWQNKLYRERDDDGEVRVRVCF